MRTSHRFWIVALTLTVLATTPAWAEDPVVVDTRVQTPTPNGTLNWHYNPSTAMPVYGRIVPPSMFQGNGFADDAQPTAARNTPANAAAANDAAAGGPNDDGKGNKQGWFVIPMQPAWQLPGGVPQVGGLGERLMRFLRRFAKTGQLNSGFNAGPGMWGANRAFASGFASGGVPGGGGFLSSVVSNGATGSVMSAGGPPVSAQQFDSEFRSLLSDPVAATEVSTGLMSLAPRQLGVMRNNGAILLNDAGEPIPASFLTMPDKTEFNSGTRNYDILVQRAAAYRISRAYQFDVAAYSGFSASDGRPPETELQQELRLSVEREFRNYGRSEPFLAVAGPYFEEEEYSGRVIPRRVRRRTLRRWHSRQMFDRRRIEEKQQVTLNSGGLAYVSRKEATFSSLSVASESEGVLADVPVKVFGVIAAEKIGGGAHLSWGGSSATDDQVATLFSATSDPSDKFFEQSKLSAQVGVGLFDLFHFDAMASATQSKETGRHILNLEEGELWAPLQKGVWSFRSVQFRTPFGILNMRGGADWWFLTAPVASTRFIGNDGMHSNFGAEFTYQGRAFGGRSGLPIRLHFGAQNAELTKLTRSGMDSFLGSTDRKDKFTERAGGRPFVTDGRDELFSRVAGFARLQVDVASCLRGLISQRIAGSTLGVSTVFGPNATGKNGDTVLGGVDLHVTGDYRPTVRGLKYDPDWIWQTEFMYRKFDADSYFDGTTFLPADTLHDWGGYTQILGATPIKDLVAGARLEYLSGSGQSYDSGTKLGIARAADPFRDDRLRASGILIWRVNKDARMRIQYVYDHTGHLPSDEAHSVWVSFEGNWGASQ